MNKTVSDTRGTFARTLALFLPGIFLLGFNLGTGSVTAMAKAGADYGMDLLWTIVLSCLATFFMINLYSRYTLVTGETALQAFRKRIHPAVGIYFIVALGLGVSGSVMGVMGIVAEICTEWSKMILPGVNAGQGIAPIWFAAFFSALVFFIFWGGRTQVFERCLAVIVAIMSACFLINFFVMMPPPADILSGLIPKLPEAGTRADGPLLVIAAMVGTTVFSGLFIIRTTLVKEAGWTLADAKVQRRDAAVSVSLMFVISMSIMAAAAGTLHVAGVTLDKAAQMISLLEPLAGSFAVSIFAVGIIAAGVSSQFPNVLMLPWLICDYAETPRDMTLPRYRIMVGLISLLGLVVPLLGARPVAVMILSQAFGAVILPVTVICIWYLTRRQDLMGTHKAGWVTQVILALILAFALLTSGLAIQGVIAKLG